MKNEIKKELNKTSYQQRQLNANLTVYLGLVNDCLDAVKTSQSIIRETGTQDMYDLAPLQSLRSELALMRNNLQQQVEAKEPINFKAINRIVRMMLENCECDFRDYLLDNDNNLDSYLVRQREYLLKLDEMTNNQNNVSALLNYQKKLKTTGNKSQVDVNEVAPCCYRMQA